MRSTYARRRWVLLGVALMLLLAGAIAAAGAAQASYQFVTAWGIGPQSPGGFSQPQDIAIDPQGNVYVDLQKFDRNGKYISRLGAGYGSGDGQFDSPAGMATDAHGNIYVADAANDRIQKFTPDGVFIAKWGSRGPGDGQFDRPVAIAVTAAGNVYVVDAGNDRIQKFTADGAFLANWGSRGTGWGQFDDPTGIATDDTYGPYGGYLYVVDAGNDRIQKFIADSIFVGEGIFMLEWGDPGTGDGDFDSAKGIAIDRDGSVHVTDVLGDRVQVFSPSGAFITKWGGSGTDDGDFDGASGIAIDPDGKVHVTDSKNDRVQKFSPSGELLAKWDNHGDGDFIYPWDVATDGAGNVYVADTYNDRIQKFTSDGAFIAKWGGSGTDAGQFDRPGAVAVDAAGNVYVADDGNDRIQKFTADGAFIAMWGIYSGGAEGPPVPPSGIAVDAEGNVYVTAGLAYVQKFTADGDFITKWGGSIGPGSEGGKFFVVGGLDVDAAGNVYVVDHGAIDAEGGQRVQKFTSDGTFLTQWGRSGTVAGRFLFPTNVATDAAGNVYVTDSMRVQKFTSTGRFIDQIGSYAPGSGPSNGEGEFSSPGGVDVDASGDVYVADTFNDRIQKFREVSAPGTGTPPPTSPAAPAPTSVRSAYQGAGIAKLSKALLKLRCPRRGNSRCRLTVSFVLSSAARVKVTLKQKLRRAHGKRVRTVERTILKRTLRAHEGRNRFVIPIRVTRSGSLTGAIGVAGERAKRVRVSER